MLGRLTETSILTLSLGIRAHARLAEAQPDDVAAVFARDDWTCHVCTTRLPDFMEIDHMAGHRRSRQEDLRTICQFCHNLKHPIWAASRGRLLAIHAPDIAQRDLTRLAWATFRLRETSPGGIDLQTILDDVAVRADKLRANLGTSEPTPLIEAALQLRRTGAEGVPALFERIDAALRFWPAELTSQASLLPDSARLSTWKVGGFHRAVATLAARLAEEPPVDFARLRAVAAQARRAMQRG